MPNKEKRKFLLKTVIMEPNGSFKDIEKEIELEID